MSDTRPADCRFRLQDEGKAYPRSACRACGKSITTGLGNSCSYSPAPHMTDKEIEAAARAAWMRNREIVAADGMEMPTWDHAEVDVKQRWRENQRAALAAVRSKQ